MNPRMMVGAAVLVVVCALVYAQSLRQRQDALRHELAIETNERDELNSVKAGLENDIARAKKIREEIADELAREEETFRSLEESLASIQAKLRGAARLKRSIERLREEYEGFKADAEQYLLTRSAGGPNDEQRD